MKIHEILDAATDEIVHTILSENCINHMVNIHNVSRCKVKTKNALLQYIIETLQEVGQTLDTKHNDIRDILSQKISTLEHLKYETV